MSQLVRLAHRLLQACGVDLKRHTPLNDPNLRRQLIMRQRAIGVVIDGGANTGEYARRLRADGYSGAIHSFEPRAAAFTRLASSCAGDPDWFCHHTALGDATDRRRLTITANGVSSSFLPQTTEMASMVPSAKVSGAESVLVSRLEDRWQDLVAVGNIAMLKLDVQGFERQALDGAGKHLRDLQLIELELPLTPLYEGAPRLEELVAHLRGHGFDPASIEANSFDVDTASVFEVDAIFSRRGA